MNTTSFYANKYILVLATSFFLFLGGISTIAFKSMFIDNLFGFQTLYEHQLKKISARKDLEVIFVGDSSLGNAIDSTLFEFLSGSPTGNFALSGSYGYAGSYNMAKKAIADNPVQTIVVFQTIDMLTRPPSYKGYLLTLSDFSDLWELSTDQLSQLLNSFYNVIFSPDNLSAILQYHLGTLKNSSQLENDYIRQSETRAVDRPPEQITPELINPDKLIFLSKLEQLCLRENIHLIYVHGPIWERVAERSNDYIDIINALLSERSSLDFVTKITPISDNDLGDSADHVSPQSKAAFTLHYYELLESRINREDKFLQAHNACCAR